MQKFNKRLWPGYNVWTGQMQLIGRFLPNPFSHAVQKLVKELTKISHISGQ